MTTFYRFERKPDEVEAVQWDGTSEGGKFIADFLMAHQKSARVKAIHDYQGSNAALVYLIFEHRSMDENRRIYKQDWVMWSRDGGIETLSNDAFIAKYIRKEKT